MNGINDATIYGATLYQEVDNDGRIPELAPAPAPAKGAAAEVPVINAPGAAAPGLPADFPENAKPAEEGSFILTFEYPVRFRLRHADGTITEQVTREIQMYRLKGKHQAEITKANREDAATQMIASSARMDFGKAKMLTDEMDAADLAAALRVVTFFLTPGRRTGR